MREVRVFLASVLALVVLLVTLPVSTDVMAAANDDDKGDALQARLDGFHELPPILTTGTGTFRAELTTDRTAIAYTLSYSDLATPALTAHIHFAQGGINGGVFVVLCGGSGKPDCPAGGATISGKITAADVLSLPDQGVVVGDLAGAVRILRSGTAYVNVHSAQFRGGEIRGQIRPADRAAKADE